MARPPPPDAVADRNVAADVRTQMQTSATNNSSFQTNGAGKETRAVRSTFDSAASLAAATLQKQTKETTNGTTSSHNLLVKALNFGKFSGAASPHPPKWRGEEDLYLTLRHRLDQLEYPEFLHLDSIHLVQRLLVDLVQTTETARSAKNELELVRQERDAAAEQVVPLRQEIARLTAENNHLHADLIAIADERDAREKRMQSTARKMEAQLADLRFMTSQYAHRVESEQRRADDARNKVEDVLSRIGADPSAKTNSVGSKSAAEKAERMFQRLQKIDIETGLEPLDPAPTHFTPPDPSIADLVRLAEGQIETLAKSNKDLESRANGLETEIQNAREQLAKREREIQRLGTQLEIARAQQYGITQRIESNVDATHANSNRRSVSPVRGTSRTIGIVSLDSAKDRIEQLEIQIEYLQEHIDGLEKEIAVHESERDTVQSAYISERDKLASDLKAERARTADLLQNLSKLEAMVNELSAVRAEASAASHGTYSKQNASRSAVANAHNPIVVKHLKQIADLTDKLKTTQQKLELTNKRLNQTITEKQRIAKELDQLKSNSAMTGSAPSQLENAQPQPSRVDVAVSTRERDSPTKSQTTLRARPYSPVRNTSASITDKEKRIHDLELTRMDLESRLQEQETRLTQLKSIEQDLDFHRTKLSSLQQDHANLQSQLALVTKKLETSDQFNHELMQTQKQVLSEMNDVRRERDDLVRALEQFGEQVDDLHARVKTVTADRDNMAMLYDQVNREVQRLRSNISESTSTTPNQLQNNPNQQQTDLQALQTIQTMESNEQRLKTQIVSLQDEIEKLQRDLEATVLRQKETGATASEALGQLETEIDQLKKTLSQMTNSNKQLQDEIRRLRVQAEQLHDEKEDVLREVERLKLRETQIEMDRERDAFHARELRSKLNETETEMTKLVEDRDALRAAAVERDKLVAEQRHMLAEIDRERDGFQSDLDHKAEQILELNDEIVRLRAEAAQAAQDVVVLREQLDAAVQSMNQQDRELGSLQRQLDQAVQERDHFETNAQRNGDEARSLSSDLAAVSRENQVLNTELVEVSIERDRLKAEVVECDRQLQYLDELIQMKDQEKENVEAMYRKLAGEHERLDKTLQASGEDVNNMKMEAILRDQRVQQLQKALDDASQQISQYKIDLGVFEKQASNLSRALATAERTVKHLEGEKSRHGREMAAARDLSHTLGRSKDELQRQTTALALENESLVHKIQRLETDMETLASQTRAERLKAERLEHMVAAERTRSMHTERSAMEIQASKGSHEEQLLRLNKEQALAIDNLNLQLESERAEASALKSRVESLQTSLRKQADELDSAKHELSQAQIKIVELQDQVLLKEKILQDFLDLRKTSDGQSDAPLTPFERKVEMALKSTASQKQKVERMIDRRSKPSAAQETSGSSSESDLGRTSRLEQEISAQISSDASGASADSVEDSDDAVAEAILSTRQLTNALRNADLRGLADSISDGKKNQIESKAAMSDAALAESEEMIRAIEQMRQSESN